MTALSELITQARAWHDQDPDPITRAELEKLILEENEAELISRFSSRLAFGTAGLRGELGAGPNRMNRVLVAQTAAGIGVYLLKRIESPSVVIGFDGRVNSEIFARDSAEVLTGMGVKVKLFDAMVPTPLTSFTTRELNLSAGIMVTASHNPPRDNGYKVYLGGDFHGSQIISPIDTEIAEAISNIAQTETFDSLTKSSAYEIIGPEIRELYLKSALAAAGSVVKKSLKIVYTPMHGVGWATIEPLFARAGSEALLTVDGQLKPDGAFPTVAFPNPEEPGALDLAFELASDYGADLIIANDPDADRLAVALPSESGWQRLTGDQVGLILGDELASKHKSGTLACSIVSSSVLSAVATYYGLEFQQTLTGFKWISKVPNLIFGYEEALGYCIDPKHVSDKDGISAALLISNIARREALANRTLWDLLNDLGERFGFFATGQISIRVAELATITRAMESLRANPPSQIAGSPAKFTDLALGLGDLPPTDGILLELSQNRRVIIRPSGTEPKLKCYLQAVGSDDRDSKEKLLELSESCNELLTNFH